MKLRAYKITIPRWFPGFCAIVAAPSRGQAKMVEFNAAWDANYHIPYIDIRDCLAPEYNHLAMQKKGRCCLGWGDNQDSNGCLEPIPLEYKEICKELLSPSEVNTLTKTVTEIARGRRRL